MSHQDAWGRSKPPPPLAHYYIQQPMGCIILHHLQFLIHLQRQPHIELLARIQAGCDQSMRQSGKVSLIREGILHFPPFVPRVRVLLPFHSRKLDKGKGEWQNLPYWLAASQ